ncbi:MAG: NUDIX domain-containing protein [Fluviicola sp.]
MKRFNLRVYGIYVSPEKEVLVTDESYNGHEFTKFPGGGLEWGEGTIECLKREFIEEFNTEITVLSHFYTTDFFQVSAFHHNDQVISVYYLIDLDFSSLKHNIFLTDSSEEVRFIPLVDLKDIDLTFPIDKKVVELIKSHFLTAEN